MQYRLLGTSGIRISVMGFGCGDLAGSAKYRPLTTAEAENLVRTALGCGINYFDTAEVYGNGESETILGHALQGTPRERVVISSKFTARPAAADVIAACEDSLLRIGTDYLDLYQAHWPAADVPPAEILTAFDRLLAEGKIRAAGACNYGAQDLAALAPSGIIVNNQLPYSLLFRAIEYEILPVCRKRSATVTCYCPLMMGLLTGAYASADEVPDAIARTRHFAHTRPLVKDHDEAGFEDETFRAIDALQGIATDSGFTIPALSLAWLQHQPGVASVISGPRSPAEVKANAAAAEITLDRELLDNIETATAPLKHLLGPNADLWRSVPRMR